MGDEEILSSSSSRNNERSESKNMLNSQPQQDSLANDTEDFLKENSDMYPVEAICKTELDHDGIRRYYVKWEGYPDYKNTWQCEKDFHDSSSFQNLLKQFEEKLKTKREEEQIDTDRTFLVKIEEEQ